MARYSKIDRRIWNDEKFRRLSHPQPCGQSLFIYLLTNPFVGPIPGLYSAGEAMLSEGLGWLELLLRHRGQWVPAYRLAELALQYSARVKELRDAGYVIENRTERLGGKVHGAFRLIACPGETRPEAATVGNMVITNGSH